MQFLTLDSNTIKAVCLTCNEMEKTVTFNRFNTSTINRHIKSVHPIKSGVVVSVEDPRCPAKFRRGKQLELFAPATKKAKTEQPSTSTTKNGLLSVKICVKLCYSLLFKR